MAEYVDVNQIRGIPQVAAGENPLHGATDISQGREMTPEWDIKPGVGTRLPFIIPGGNPGPVLEIIYNLGEGLT